MKMISIPMTEYLEMCDRLVWLDCLEGAGVDNWQGIDVAHELYKEATEND
jgi:hypothetical protein